MPPHVSQSRPSTLLDPWIWVIDYDDEDDDDDDDDADDVDDVNDFDADDDAEQQEWWLSDLRIPLQK